MRFNFLLTSKLADNVICDKTLPTFVEREARVENIAVDFV